MFVGSSGWMFFKNVKQTSTPFTSLYKILLFIKENLIKTGHFSCRDEVFIWKTLLRTSEIPPGRMGLKASWLQITVTTNV